MVTLSAFQGDILDQINSVHDQQIGLVDQIIEASAGADRVAGDDAMTIDTLTTAGEARGETDESRTARANENGFIYGGGDAYAELGGPGAVAMSEMLNDTFQNLTGLYSAGAKAESTLRTIVERRGPGGN